MKSNFRLVMHELIDPKDRVVMAFQGKIPFLKRPESKNAAA
ncbi:hypothetical protein [Leptospira gomenensis]|nr:hypothetical protein [Leptospira gomenensis]